MTWTREQLYRQIDDVSKEEWEHLEKSAANCPWRQTYHIQPETGLLNDPNGFCYYNGEYHLFYQWFPLGPVHGLKHWCHTSSKDLVHWKNHGPALFPDTPYDSHGVYSGSGIVHENMLHLFYTGNTRDNNWNRNPYQCHAVMDKEAHIKKDKQPIISAPPNGYTEHFRDPKVWRSGDAFYMVVGAQRENKTGTALLYTSNNLIDWKLVDEIKTNYANFGFMWECPDYFELQNQGVLVFSPQGIEPEGERFRNFYQAGYLTGERLDVATGRFEHRTFRELDAGFDFYAPQTTETPDGRRIMVGWMGLPEISYPTDRNLWAHCLTLPRELTVKNNKVIQKPAAELRQLRANKKTDSFLLDNYTLTKTDWSGECYEFICEIEGVEQGKAGVAVRAGQNEETRIFLDTENQRLTLDRTHSGEPVAEDFGTTRSIPYLQTNVTLQIFVDSSSVEIFVNDGGDVFTARIFPSKESQGIRFFAENSEASFIAEKWELKY
ncbi:glycoside hydrolase family 32 protein [Alteribacillus sp. JSM 102045]|uniref:glycoside hydrolase family 32 protein n=1 Tax=Alteribacillus sp. JSM 102045 TaxID=1562101 RepID=UPI0035C012E4